MSTTSEQHVTMEKLLSLSKRRGFLFQSSEIYGGLNATWDYGPLGAELKRNVKDAWWRSMVQHRDDTVGFDSAILMHPSTWQASGHLGNFSDPLVECSSCHRRFRADDLDSTDCPICGHQLSDPRQFNLMFKTFMGPVEDSASEIYLRPETAQGIYVNFKNVLNSTRRKLPFGIAQIGKAFRNEITPSNSTFRTREFEIMELEFFVRPGSDEEWHNYWVEQRLDWFISHGIDKENLRLRPHRQDELAHYAKAVYDIEYRFPWGWAELEGIANRTDFDLRQHADHSGQDLTYFDDQTQERFFPYVIEPSCGADRAALAFLLDAYQEETSRPPSPRQSRNQNPPPPAPAPRPHYCFGAPPQSQPKAGPHRPQGPCPDTPELQYALRRRSKHRSPLQTSGRNWHSLLRHGGLRHTG